ncbi:MFS transporter [Streptomyces sp. NPDC058534]|uniref:MFS transporter n=1 Tax=Streptomyces sp. NPDC058534 TaxID=3346541 RepID=UPI003659B740
MSRNSASLAVLCASVFVVGTSEYLVAGMLPEVGADLQVPQSTAGQAVTAYALGVVIGGPAVTMLTARLPRRPLALGLMLLFAAGSAFGAMAPSFTMLLAGRVVSSLSHAAFLALALVMATSLVPEHKTGSAIATVASGFTVVTLLGVPLGSLLGHAAGWRAPFAVLTALTLAAIALLALVLPKQQPSSAGLRDELRVVSHKPVLLAVASTAVGFSGVAVVFTYIAPLLTRIAGFSPAAVSALLFAYGAGSFLGNRAAGKLTDRSMSATVRGVFGGLTGALVAMPFAAAWQPTAVLAVLALGLLASRHRPAAGIDPAPCRLRPDVVAANVGAFNLGAAAGSALGGAIVAAGALRWTGLAGAVLSLTGLALTYLVLPRTGTAQHTGNAPVGTAV